MDTMQKVCINGKSSPWAQVASGIPQGNVIGPVLFMLYINDLPDVVLNDVHLCADHSKVYSEISNVNDCGSLQEDLDNVKKSSGTWLLACHRDKCKVLRLGNSTGVARMNTNWIRSL